MVTKRGKTSEEVVLRYKKPNMYDPLSIDKYQTSSYDIIIMLRRPRKLENILKMLKEWAEKSFRTKKNCKIMPILSAFVCLFVHLPVYFLFCFVYSK